jgi:hypothetical protein
METKEFIEQLKNAPVSERVKMLLEVYTDITAAGNKVSDIAKTAWIESDHDDAMEPFLLAVDEAKFKLSELIGLYIYDSFTSIKAVV